MKDEPGNQLTLVTFALLPPADLTHPLTHSPTPTMPLTTSPPRHDESLGDVQWRGHSWTGMDRSDWRTGSQDAHSPARPKTRGAVVHEGRACRTPKPLRGQWTAPVPKPTALAHGPDEPGDQPSLIAFALLPPADLAHPFTHSPTHPQCRATTSPPRHDESLGDAQ